MAPGPCYPVIFARSERNEKGMTRLAKSSVRYLVFDVESVADGELVARIRHPGETIDPATAVQQYREELMAKHDSDFIPYTYQLPVSVVVAKVSDDFRLLDLVALDEPQFRPHVITEHFWRGWEAYKRPTLVSFNGRSFDLPLLELASFRYGLSLPGWFYASGKTYEQPRNRYNTEAHLDLHDTLTNFGASRFHGGLNLAAQLLGKPGKMDVQGNMVQDFYNAGKFSEINDYCRCDVLDTYFIFLRCQVLLGRLTLPQEQKIVAEAHDWIANHAKTIPVLSDYLSRWGNWHNPWHETPPAP
ncbi:polysaccharide biosynthesis protein [Pirellula staleyi DSM 6068]|uniref:Polysaccharide biosynthesis protein n=1 Tax=Pirellula staleyi (strain ATCC 27377 / DSM 6068 / ICPB 4128) TaxID=530564 RepID=D2QWV8_PIRSD|nr:polysaccharide biosynthesis protein [Pirellula staleyi DSM 6068]